MVSCSCQCNMAFVQHVLHNLEFKLSALNYLKLSFYPSKCFSENSYVHLLSQHLLCYALSWLWCSLLNIIMRYQRHLQGRSESPIENDLQERSESPIDNDLNSKYVGSDSNELLSRTVTRLVWEYASAFAHWSDFRWTGNKIFFFILRRLRKKAWKEIHETRGKWI